MHLMKSGLTGEVTVQDRTASVSVSIPAGGTVDVDRLLAEGVTVGDALGEYLTAFTDVESPKVESRRKAAPAEAKE